MHRAMSASRVYAHVHYMHGHVKAAIHDAGSATHCGVVQALTLPSRLTEKRVDGRAVRPTAGHA